MSEQARIMIGEGVLNWHRYERVSNRYGAVILSHHERRRGWEKDRDRQRRALRRAKARANGMELGE